MQYLSDEWLDEAARLFHAADSPLPRDADFTIQQLVAGTPHGDVAYTLVLSGQSVSLTKGVDPGATVSFQQEWSTAVGVARGDLSAQAAFMSGEIQLGGDTSTLVNNHDLLVEVDDLLKDLRAQTTFDA